MANKILVLFAHPAIHRSIVNRRLRRVYIEFDNIKFRDLYDIYPEFMIDAEIEQQLLIEHDLIIFHHPVYWYSAPPILKQWQDLVLRNGFAFGPGGNALKGKRLLSVVSTGQDESEYSDAGQHSFTIRQMLRPFEQTAVFCGMHYLPPFVAFGPMRKLNRQRISGNVKNLRKVLIALSKSDFDVHALDHLQHINEDMQIFNTLEQESLNAL